MLSCEAGLAGSPDALARRRRRRFEGAANCLAGYPWRHGFGIS